MEHDFGLEPYYTVRIPWSATPTKWHPTDKTGPFAVLTRGAFTLWEDAARWAMSNLGDTEWTIKQCGMEPAELCNAVCGPNDCKGGCQTGESQIGEVS